MREIARQTHAGPLVRAKAAGLVRADFDIADVHMIAEMVAGGALDTPASGVSAGADRALYMLIQAFHAGLNTADASADPKILVRDRCAAALAVLTESPSLRVPSRWRAPGTVAEAAPNPKVGAILRTADAEEREMQHELFRAVIPAECNEAELVARCEVISMLFEGMTMRGVNNPDDDRQAIARVLRSTLRHLLAEPCGDRVS